MPTRYRRGTGFKWEAKVQLERKNYMLGTYDRYSEAERAENEFKQALRQITEEAQAFWRLRAAGYSVGEVPRINHLETALSYFSHTHISPPEHAKDLAVRALAGERIWEL